MSPMSCQLLYPTIPFRWSEDGGQCPPLIHLQSLKRSLVDVKWPQGPGTTTSCFDNQSNCSTLLFYPVPRELNLGDLCPWLLPFIPNKRSYVSPFSLPRNKERRALPAINTPSKPQAKPCWYRWPQGPEATVSCFDIGVSLDNNTPPKRPPIKTLRR